MQTPHLFMLPEESTCVHIDLVLSVGSKQLYVLLCSLDRSSSASKICMRLYSVLLCFSQLVAFPLTPFTLLLTGVKCHE